MRDIAKKANVSLATVSRAFQHTGYVAEDKRKLIFKTALELGYSEKPAHIVSKSSRTIAVITLDSVFPFFLDPFVLLNTFIMRYAHVNNYHVLSFPVSVLDSQSLLQILPSVYKTNPAGIIILGSIEGKPSTELKELLKKNCLPTLNMGRSNNYYDVNKILVDNTHGIYLSTQYLIEKGHRHLLYVSSDILGEDVEADRLKGFQQAIDDAKIPGLESHIFYDHGGINRKYSLKSAYQAAKEAFGKYPNTTGIVNWSDGYAAGELQYLTAIGKKIPDDVEIMGFDDIITPYLAPPLSSIQMPYEEMALEAVNLIIDTQNSYSDPVLRSITLSPKLIIR